MKKIRYSENFLRDYQFYLNNMEKFNFCGEKIEWPEDSSGLTAQECFWIFDTHGQIKPCKEKIQIESVLRCKKSINLHIKMWAEGFWDLMEPLEFYLESFQGEIPEWVAKSLEKAKNKEMIKNSGV